jgi:uncharacterized protein VirK/YbjX
MAVFTRQAPAVNSIVVGPISALARQSKTWSPELLAGVLWRGLTHLGSHRKVVQLLQLEPYAEAARNNPRFGFKYLTHDYLAQGLTTAQCAAGFLHHYRRLHSALPERLLRDTLSGNTTIHEIRTEHNQFAISMGLSRDFDKEGELSLNFHVDGEVAFLMACTIVPGEIVHSPASEVVLISRVQGMKGSYPGIHLATKALHDVSPGASLLAALQGIAIALGIENIAAVSAARQSSFNAQTSAELKQGYDEFFVGAGLPQNERGFFLSPVPIQLKPMSQVKKGHKIRTKEKRAYKERIQTACMRFMQNANSSLSPETSFEL